MTFPSGAPGEFPGQGPQQPQPQGPPQQQQQYPGAAPYTGSPGGGGSPVNLSQILFLAIGGLALLNLFLGFAKLDRASSVLETHGWVSGLLLASGITALFKILPGEQKPGPWPAVFAVSGMLPFLFGIFKTDASLKVGGILVLIFGIIQMLVAVAAYLFDSGLLPPLGVGSSSGPASPYGQQQFGQQPGAFGQQPQTQVQTPGMGGAVPGQQPGSFGQQGQQGGQPPMQQPPAQQQPPTQQPTQYAAHQGQFFQHQSPEGQQQNAPGTPPGGTNQPNG